MFRIWIGKGENPSRMWHIVLYNYILKKSVKLWLGGWGFVFCCEIVGGNVLWLKGCVFCCEIVSGNVLWLWVVVQDEPTALPGGPEELPPRLQEPL